MNASEHVRLYAEFLEKTYYNEIHEHVRTGDKQIVIDFGELAKFNLELVDALLDQPENSLKAAQLALAQYDEQAKDFVVRVKNLPPTASVLVRNIRSKHLNKFFQLEGVVRQKSDVRPQVTSASFECPSCGNTISVIQVDTKFKEPSRCTCGRKGRFHLLSKQLVDAQGIVLEEIPEQLEGGAQPKRINIFLQNELVSPITEKRTNPGATIRVTGTLKEVPIILKTGVQSTRFDLLFEANHVMPVDEDFTDIQISEEEEKEIKELVKDPNIAQRLLQSIAPNIYGHDTIKEALILQLLGGVRKTADFGPATRGDIHILLIGDPGAGKCVAGDSLIVLHTGEILPIKEFITRYEQQSQLPKVYSLGLEGKNLASRPLRVWKRPSPKTLLRIRTATGHELLLTKEHPLFTTEQGLIFAKPAEKFVPGDYISTLSKLTVEGTTQTLPTIVPSKAHNRRECRHPPVLDGNMARLLGYLTGDGHVRITPAGGYLGLTNVDEALLQDFEKLVQTLFQRTVSKRKKQGTPAKEYSVYSRELSRFIWTIEPTLLQRSGEKSVSPLLMKSPNSIVKEYIKALYDCEGHVVKTKREIEFSTKSKLLAEQLRILLLRYGIYSQLSSAQKCATNTKLKIKRTYYRLRITGENVARYAQEIGFTSPEKKATLEKVMSRGTSYNTNINVVPHMKTLLSTLRRKYALSQFSLPILRSTCQHYEKGDRNPSRNKLKKLSEFYNALAPQDPLVSILSQASSSDIFWDKIVSVQEEPSSEEHVYDLEIDQIHNFVANGIMIHNSQLLKRISKVAPKARFISGKGVSGAGLTASVVKDEFLGGWSLEAGALVLASRGVCCTTGDSSFLCEDGRKMTFDNLFANSRSAIVYPTFKIFALNTATKKIEPFSIKCAFRKKNDKKIYELITRTGRVLALTEENEVLTCKQSQQIWTPIEQLRVGEYVAVPKTLPVEGQDTYDERFAYIAGLLASDGSVQLNNRHGKAGFYNTDESLIKLFQKILDGLGHTHSTSLRPAGRVSFIDGKPVHSKKPLYYTYNSTKRFVNEVLSFGIPNGEKSMTQALDKRIVMYSSKTIASFLRGVFDGDGSIRENPYEVTITTGILENARLFQELFLRLGIISSVKRSTRSWHCDIRGVQSVQDFFHIVGTSHPEKKKRFNTISTKEEKDRLNILPNHQEFFESFLKHYRGKLGVSRFKYFWQYAKKKTAPSLYKLSLLNKSLDDFVLQQHFQSHVLWDKIVSLRERKDIEYVYDFTMKGTNNFIANNVIMHNCIDELDKMGKDDTAAMHEALEGQTITISKANVQATLRAETTVLAAANPKHGRFDNFAPVGSQIDLPPTLINRFDLIFPIKDLPEKEKDEKTSSFILSLHQKGSKSQGDIDTPLLRKYITYCRQRVRPVLTDAAIAEIQQYYLSMRASGSGGKVKSVPISARQLEALVRLSEAAAKLRLSEKVLKKDAQTAVRLVDYFLRQVALDEETGKIDIDKLSTGVSASQRSRIIQVKEIVAELEATFQKVIPLENIISSAEAKGITKSDAEEIIQKLKRTGDLFEPKRGFISRI